MPKMKKWMGDLSEKLFSKYYSETVIVEIQYYDNTLKRVRFQGEKLKGVNWLASQEIEFRVSPTEYRHYTPMCWDAENGYVDVIFYLHGKGVGSHWADKLKKGDVVNLIGPAGKFVASDTMDKIFMIGDETSLSTYYAMQEMSKASKKICLLELLPENSDWANKINLNATIVQTTENVGQELVSWITEFVKTPDFSSYTYFLSGNALTIQMLRKLLIQSGVNSKQVLVKPYWKEGKQGL